jgi:hypothetical protein
MAYLLPGFLRQYLPGGINILDEKPIEFANSPENLLGAASWKGFNKPTPEIPQPGPVDVELLSGLESSKNGTITLYGQTTNGAGLDHIFSFVYYLPPTSNFEGSLYHFGLTAYLNMVHATDFPFQCGMIIYTDAYTFPTLRAFFPEERYPKLTLAVVSWAYFSSKEGIVNFFILRTLRYHAVQQYPNKNVHIRDADTLFVVVGKSNFGEQVKKWEQKYLEFVKAHVHHKQIVIGASSGYGSDYHQNLPYPIEFTFPMRTIKGKSQFEKFTKSYPYTHLYTTANILKPENNAVITNISQDILYRKPDDYKAAEYFTKYKEYVDGLKKEEKTLNYYSKKDQQRRGEIKKSIDEILEKAKDDFKQTIPKERLQPAPFSYTFKKEFMYYPYYAIYAGFVSVLKDRSGIRDFWDRCVQYLLQRYRMTLDLETGKEIVSNELLKPGDEGHPIAMGKDERMILYGIVPDFLSKILFLPIDYSTELTSYGQLPNFVKQNEYFSPKKIAKHLNETTSYSLSKSFQEESENYKHWLAEFYKKYPTEENFLNKVNAVLEEHLIPLSNSRLQPLPMPSPTALSPYKAYNKAGRKATIRRAKGGKRLTKRHQKTLKRK